MPLQRFLIYLYQIAVLSSRPPKSTFSAKKLKLLRNISRPQKCMDVDVLWVMESILSKFYFSVRRNPLYEHEQNSLEFLPIWRHLWLSNTLKITLSTSSNSSWLFIRRSPLGGVVGRFFLGNAFLSCKWQKINKNVLLLIQNK